MNWDPLLCAHRIGLEKQKTRQQHRPPWQYDYDRIAFSSAFRRLQDKTQVFPLSSSDYVRTRLTHSIEAACVARSLGNLVGFSLQRRGVINSVHPLEIGMITSAATLAHDIGNPPFGHSGESAIQSWFDSSPIVKKYCGSFNARQIADFSNFEGNAQGFRMLARLRMRRDNGGMQLTAAVLGAFSKYPIESRIETEPESKRAGEKKFGFFQSEAELFNTIAEKLGLLRLKGARRGWSRHPLAFLVEAADDICYRLVDFEDALQQKLIPAKKVEALLAEAAGGGEVLKKARREKSQREQVNYLRSKAIGFAIEASAKAFLNNQKRILSGTLHKSLVSLTPCEPTFEAIRELQREHVYRDDRVLKVETAGFKVIGGLLEAFFKAVCEVAEKKGNIDLAPQDSAKLFKLIPEEFVGERRAVSSDVYERLLRITDYICGMTDSYALNLYRSISGISLP